MKSKKEIVAEFGEVDLVVMCGLPGSGKSYWARKIADRMGGEVVSSDSIRMKKFLDEGEGKYFSDDSKYERYRNRVYGLLHKKVIEMVRSGLKVVVDATYLGPQREMLLEKLRNERVVSRAVMVVIKCSERTVKERKVRGKEAKEDLKGWQHANKWFVNRLLTGEIRYPREELDGIKVVEVNNG